MVTTFLTWLGLLTVVAYCQDTSTKPLELPLPERALWRFGEMDSTESNGFYLLTYSPNGKLLATRNRKNLIQIHNVEDRKLISEWVAYDNRVKSFEFSPDSNHLMTVASAKDPVKIWDVHTGKLKLKIDEEVLNARFSSSGKSILILGPILIAEFSWPAGKLIDRIDNSRIFQKSINLGLAINNNGRYVITQSKMNNQQFNLTKLIDVNAPSSVILPGPSQKPKSIIVSNDNNWIAAIYPRQEKIRLWNLHDPHGEKYELTGHSRTVESIAFSKDSRFLVSTGWDKRVVVWDVLTQKQIAKLKGHDDRANCVDFSPKELTLATGASGLNDSTVIIWSIEHALLPEPVKEIATEEQFDIAWLGLGDASPTTALAHANNLRHSIEQSLAWLEVRIGQKTTTSMDVIRNSIKNLQANTFSEREAATQQLIELRGTAEQILMETLENAESTELKYRINLVLNHAIERPKIDASELRRLHRAIYLLELVADKQEYRELASNLLLNLSLNHPHIDIARDAKFAIDRIKNKPQ